MRGTFSDQGRLFSYISPEARVVCTENSIRRRRGERAGYARQESLFARLNLLLLLLNRREGCFSLAARSSVGLFSLGTLSNA